MAYPSSLDTFGTPAGTSVLGSPDHALDHRTLGSSVGTIQQVIGTNSGTAIAMNFIAGNFAARINSSNVPQQALNAGTFGTAILGTPSITGGTIGTAIIGTSTIQGGTINNAVVGSPTITGGTINNVVIGSPTITGGTANALTLGTPIIGTITVPGTVAGLSFSAAIAPGVGTITDSAGGTLTVNAQQGNIFYSVQGTAAGNRTIGTPLNPTGYQQLTYAFKSSGSANGTLVWPTGAGAFTLSQDVGTPAIGTGVSWSYYAWRYSQISSKWEFNGQSKNII